MKIIHVLNIHIVLFSWVYGTLYPQKYFNMKVTYFNTNIYYHCTVDIMHEY